MSANGGLHGADILLDEMSVTGTENAVMAAVLRQGHDDHPQRRVRAARAGPLQHAQLPGRARSRGVGTNTLTIQGVDRLGGGEFTISPDYLEVGSFMGLGAVTRGEIRIHGVVPDHMRMINLVFARSAGRADAHGGRHADRGRRAGAVHPRGRRRRGAEDRRCALAPVPGRPDEHRAGGGHPGARAPC